MATETTPSDSHMEDTSNPKISAVRCEVCVKREAKYRCPACSMRTCSLPCVLRHKKEQGCRGERSKTAYVAVKDFTDANLLSDLRFLEESARKAEIAKNERLDKDKASPFRMKALLSQARQRGVQLTLMPPGLSRHKQNTSMYHFQDKEIQWRVEWYLPQENLTFVDDRFSETGIIMEGVENHVQRMLSPKKILPFLPQSTAHQHNVESSSSLPNKHDSGQHSSQQSHKGDTNHPDSQSNSVKSDPESHLLQSHETGMNHSESQSHSRETDHSDSKLQQSHNSDTDHPDSHLSVNSESNAIVMETAMSADSEPLTLEPFSTPVPQSGSSTSFEACEGKTSIKLKTESSLPQVDDAGSGTSHLTTTELACPVTDGGGGGGGGERAASTPASPSLRTYTMEGGRRYHVFLKVQGLKANKERYYELNKTLSLKKNLQGKHVIEFPTLHIVPEQAACSYVRLTADDERELRAPLCAGAQPYYKTQHRFRGNRSRGRRGPRHRYKDADTYNPNSKIFQP